MKVLYVLPVTGSVSGSVTVAKAIIKVLSKKGISISILNTDLNHNAIEYFENNTKVYNILKYPYYPLTSPELWIRKQIPDIGSYDLVHINMVWPPGHFFLAKALNKMGIKYILSPHGNLMPAALQYRKFKKLLGLYTYTGYLIRKSKCIHVLGNEEDKGVKSNFPSAPTQIIPNGVMPKITKINSDKIIKKYTLPKKLNLLFLGRIDIYHKGLDLLIKAIADIPSSYNITLDLVGSVRDDTNERHLKKLIKKTENKVTICKPIKNPKKYFFSNYDFMILTSRYEGLPMVILEALSAGLPCIVSRGTNTAEIIQESKSGLVSQGDVSSIKETVLLAYNTTSNERRIMGKNGESWVSTHLQWTKIADHYKNMYESI